MHPLVGTNVLFRVGVGHGPMAKMTKGFRQEWPFEDATASKYKLLAASAPQKIIGPPRKTVPRNVTRDKIWRTVHRSSPKLAVPNGLTKREQSLSE